MGKPDENYGLIGSSKHLRRVRKQIEKAAEKDLHVIIEGPTGTGKTPIAKAIHNHGKRRNGPFIIMDCAIGNEHVIDDRLFGHVYGAFTGATRKGRAGAFERANNGTLFLDEIGNAPRFTQEKILSAIDEREIERLGGSSKIKIDVRIIAATNKDLRKEIKGGMFKDDLFYRLSKLRIKTKALHERPIDIIRIIDHLLIQKKIIDDSAEQKAVMEKAKNSRKPEIEEKQVEVSSPANKVNTDLNKANRNPSVKEGIPKDRQAGKKGKKDKKPRPKRARVPKLTSIKFLIYHHDLPGNVRELDSFLDKSFTEVRMEFVERKREIQEEIKEKRNGDFSRTQSISSDTLKLIRKYVLMRKVLRISKGELKDKEKILIRKVISRTEGGSKLKQAKLHHHLIDWCVKVYEIVRLVRETDLSNEDIAIIAGTRRNVVTPKGFENRFGIPFPKKGRENLYDLECPLDCLQIMESV